jgi:nucleoside-diphosphate-sugar epimerase
VSVIRKALVTGANGFIGSNVCAALRGQGIVTRGLILPGTDTSVLEKLGVEVVEADITRPLPGAVCEGISHVFHLAAIPFDWGPASLFQSVNVRGTDHVLAAAAKAGVEHVVHMSSLAVHAYSGHSNGDETTPCDGHINHYAVSKVQAEQVVRGFADRLQVTIIRPGVVPYGPGDRLSLPGIVQALEKGIYLHVGGGYTRVCLSYVGNLAEGMVQAARREGSCCETYVLADEVVTWRGFIEAIAEAFNKKPPRASLPYSVAYGLAFLMEQAWRWLPLPGAPELTRYRISLFRGDLVFSSDKARREIGYRPAVGLQEGLTRTRAWMEEHNLP